MTIKEAIRILVSIIGHLSIVKQLDDPRYTALEMAISSLEKQIPNRPKMMDFFYLCLKCSAKVGAIDKYYPMSRVKWCFGCGQAIDWSDEL